MADLTLSQLPSFYGDIFKLAQGGGIDHWLNLGIGLILSTIIGGLVLFAIVSIAGREWHEGIHPLRAFFVVLVINIISAVGLMGILGFDGILALVFPLVVWIALLKVFFMELAFKHVLILSVVSYAASLFIVPYLISFVFGFLKF